MTVREYIGARYVPLFIGDWDNTVTYEPLSIVSYQGNSYISRQYVPTGIAITNELYWVETGNYNAQIEAYRQEVLTFDGRITTNANDIAALDTRLDSDEGTLSSLQTAVGNHTTAINKLNLNAIPKNRFKNKVSLGFGDSNMNENVAYTDRSAYHLLCDYLGCEYHNKGVNGAAWQEDVGAAGVSFLDEINGENEVNANNVELVVIIGGINDFHYADISITNFNNAVANTLNAVHTKYPNALVMVAFDGGSQLPNKNMLYYQASLALRCDYAQCLVVPTADMCLRDGWWFNQNHYGTYGCQELAARMYKTLFGGTFGVAPQKYIGATYNAQNPTDTGYSNILTQTFVEIDPFTFTRRDHVKIRIINLAHTSHTWVPANETIFRIPIQLNNDSFNFHMFTFFEVDDNSQHVTPNTKIDANVSMKFTNTNAASVVDNPSCSVAPSYNEPMGAFQGTCYFYLENTLSGFNA